MDYDKIDAVNWSRLKRMAVSPLHYYCTATSAEDNDALRRGRAVHLAILEPEKYQSSVAIWPDGKRRAGSAWFEFAQENKAKLIITSKIAEGVEGMRRAVLDHQVAVNYLKRGEAEKIITWIDSKTGVACKARVDWVSGEGAIVDLKTARSAIDARAFAADAYRRGYFGQLAYYRRGIGGTGHCVIVAVEPTAPFDVAVYELDATSLAECDEEIDRLLARVRECRESGSWPGSAPEARLLKVPGWARDCADDEASDPDWVLDASLGSVLT